MKTRRLGDTDLELSVIGMGTWAVGGGGWRYAWGPQDDEESVRALLRGVEMGVNWIDTAPVYGLGHAEEVVGRALKEISPPPLVATKLGRRWKDDGTIYGDLAKSSVKEECEMSLRRLGIERIDLYQIHWPDPEDRIEEAWEAVAELVEEGKVRYAGVSNFSVEQMERVRKIHPVASLQPPYSMLRRGIEEEILPYCGRNGIGVVVYSPLQKGLLTGKYTREKVAALPEDDHRRGDPRFREPHLGLNLELVDRLKRVAERYGKTCTQLALAWVLRRGEVTSAITGTRRPAQIEEAVAAGEWELPEEAAREIEELLAEHERKTASLC